MKSKQVLDVHQMQHLQELGLEMKETMLYWARCVDNNPRAATHYGKWVLIKGNNAQTVGLMHWEFIPAYTLQDMLDALPDFIDEHCLIIDMSFGVIRYDNLKGKNSPILKEIYFNDEDNYLIDSAYELLVWCVENKFVETNKNE
jgi:hypothetical protein